MKTESAVADSSLIEIPLRHLSGVAFYAVGFGGLLMLWFVVSLVVANRTFLPSPLDTANALIHLAASGVLVKQVLASLVRVFLGFALGAVCALALGTLIGLFGSIEKAVEPILELFRAIPPYAMIPFALLTFGIGAGGKLFILAYATFFPVLVSTVSGVSNVPVRLIEASHTLGASRSFTVLRVLIPAAIPQILLGLRLGFGAAWLSLIAAEMVASSDGLGFLIADARETIDTPVVVAGMVVIGVLGYLANQFLVALEQRVGAP